jgi:DNA-binding PadR family transcriptional regulator
MTREQPGPLSLVRSTRDLLALAILTRGDAHGAEVHQQLAFLTGDRDAPLTAVYQTLHRLERRGLALGIGVRPGAAPNSRSFCVTEAGRALLRRYASALKT